MQRAILLVEDDEAIARVVIYALEREGFIARHHRLGGEALAWLEDNATDLAILDLGLPDMSGLDLCRAIRARRDLPVIFLTARSEEIDRVLGLELGGDDYVTKPFSPRELVARVRAVLRRVRANHGEATRTPPDAAPPLFAVDAARREIQYQGVALALTRYEYRLLERLLASPGRVLSRGQIMEEALESADTSLERSVDTHVKSLRAKLKAVDPDFDPLTTHRGFGYSIAIRKPETAGMTTRPGGRGEAAS